MQRGVLFALEPGRTGLLVAWSFSCGGLQCAARGRSTNPTEPQVLHGTDVPGIKSLTLIKLPPRLHGRVGRQDGPVGPLGGRHERPQHQAAPCQRSRKHQGWPSALARPPTCREHLGIETLQGQGEKKRLAPPVSHPTLRAGFVRHCRIARYARDQRYALSCALRAGLATVRAGPGRRFVLLSSP